MFQRVLGLGLVLTSIAACGAPPADDNGQQGLALSSRTAGNRDHIPVETHNLYVGFDITTLLTAPNLPALAQAVTAGYASVQATDFASRADQLAHEIATTHPDLVGLQEVATYYVQTPGDSLTAHPTPATTVTIDFLQLLLGSLEARGQHYHAVAIVRNTDAELPDSLGNDIRLADHEVILARDDIETSNSQAHNYTARLIVTLPGTNVQLQLPRGWVSVDVGTGSGSYRFVSTHLETEAAPPIQAAQANELLAALSGTTLPTILVGDFNSAADGSTTTTHSMVLADGYSDAWALARASQVGYTCCQEADLLNSRSELSQRIDYIFFRGSFDVINTRLVGDLLGERVSGGLWPSDHAGVFGTLRLM